MSISCDYYARAFVKMVRVECSEFQFVDIDGTGTKDSMLPVLVKVLRLQDAQ